MMRFSNTGTHCLDSNPNTKEIFVARCNEDLDSQKWTWGFVNTERLNQYDIVDPLP